MRRKSQFLLIFAGVFLLLLAACDTEFEPDKSAYNELLPFTVTFTYPPHQMHEFPLTGNMVVRYNEPFSQDTSADLIRLQRVDEDQTVHQVPLGLRVVDTSLIIAPKHALKPLHHYQMIITDKIKGESGQVPELPEQGLLIDFYTSADRPQAGEDLYVTTVLPDPTDELIFDVSTFRAYFSEPLDQRTVTYGDTVSFTDADGELIEGELFTRGAQIVFDPDEDLAPGTYYFSFTTGIKDAGGERLPAGEQFEFEVITSYPHANLVVENCPTMGSNSACEPVASPDMLDIHPLTGQATNSMRLWSNLLGVSTVYISGQLHAEQGDANDHPDLIPMVIRKGQRLYATSLPVMLGGSIATGLETGPIVIQLLTDAVGYIQPSDANGLHGGGTVFLSLVLDSAITTEDVIANNMLTQNILGTRLFGQMFIDPDEGRLVMQVAGAAEVFILGERAAATMSLEMRDAMEVLDVQPDNKPPAILTTSPVSATNDARLGDDIIVLFDETIDVESARGNIRLTTAAGAPLTQTLLINGAKVLIRPGNPLRADTTYTINVGAGVMDITGNATVRSQTFRFGTGSVESSAEPPILGSTSPGHTLSASVPGQIPIEVFFSQIMDPDTIELGDTFQVIDRSTGFYVPGTLVKHWYRYAFYPNDPMESGHYYRVVLSGEITNYDGIPLDLDRDHEPGGLPGIDEIWIDFVSSGPNRWLPLLLAIDPLADRDGSGYIDNTETEPYPKTNYFNILGPLIPQNSYAGGYMISYVRGMEIDAQGDSYMDIFLIPGNFLYATSTVLDLGYIIHLIQELLGGLGVEPGKDDGMFDPMGRILVDVVQPGAAPTVESPTGIPQMNLTMTTAMTLDNEYINYMMEHELILSATGLLGFTPDGKMKVDIEGDAKMTLNFEVPLLGFNIPLPLPVDIQMRTTTLTPLDWWNAF